MAAIAKGAEAFHGAGKVLDGHGFVTGETLDVTDSSLGAEMKLADMAHYPLRALR